MNFDKVTNPMMKAFFQRLSNQIDKSDIPDGGPSQTTSPVTEVEPDETQILKDAIAKLQQDLDESNSKVQSQNSEIDKLKQEVDTADLDYTLLKSERDNFETKIADLEKQISSLNFSYEVLEAENGILKTKAESLEHDLEDAKTDIKPGFVSIQDLMNEAHTLDRASRLNLITSLERLLAHQSGDIDKILESERNSLNVEIKDEDYSQDEDGRSVFVVIKTLDKIFKKLGIVQKADNLKLARLYAYISGYKYTTIKNRLPVDDDIPERSKDEVRTVQKLLNDVNSGISMN